MRTISLIIILLITCNSNVRTQGSFISGGFSTERTIDDPCIPNVPNAFSPNADGINDLFEVRAACSFDHLSLQIYDQSENLVYKEIGESGMWNGTIQGKPAPEGTYQWIVTYKSKQRTEKELSGKVLLLR